MSFGEIFFSELAVVVLTLISIAKLFAPEFMWELEHMLDTYGGEPSEWYLKTSKIIGFVGMIVFPILGIMMALGL